MKKARDLKGRYIIDVSKEIEFFFNHKGITILAPIHDRDVCAYI
jgi:hypothetical protein